MRTTLNIRDNVLEQVKEYAHARGISTGDAASILVERGLQQGTPVRKDGHFYVFSSGEKSALVTLEHALRIEDDSE